MQPKAPQGPWAAPGVKILGRGQKSTDRSFISKLTYSTPYRPDEIPLSRVCVLLNWPVLIITRAQVNGLY